MKYQIELLRDGLEDIPSFQVRPAQKLQKLLDRRRSLETMTPKMRYMGFIENHHTINVAGGLIISVVTAPREDIEMDSDGSESHDSDSFQIKDSILDLAEMVDGLRVEESVIEYKAKIQVIELPNLHIEPIHGLRVRVMYQWGFIPSEVRSDPAQNLLVLCEWGSDGKYVTRSSI